LRIRGGRLGIAGALAEAEDGDQQPERHADDVGEESSRPELSGAGVRVHVSDQTHDVHSAEQQRRQPDQAKKYFHDAVFIGWAGTELGADAAVAGCEGEYGRAGTIVLRDLPSPPIPAP
jgi:hypothetical protein